MTLTVMLRCPCGRSWQIVRRRGQYPQQCPDCSRLQWHARRVAGRARRCGITATVARDEQGIWRATTVTPWHDRPVMLLDLLDVDYLAAELARVQPAGNQEAA